MDNNIFISDGFEMKKKPVYQGVERKRDFEINKSCCDKCAKKKKKRGKKISII